MIGENVFDKCKSQNVKSYLVYALSHEHERGTKRPGGGVAMMVVTTAAVREPFPPWAGSQCLLGVTSFHPGHRPMMSAL